MLTKSSAWWMGPLYLIAILTLTGCGGDNDNDDFFPDPEPSEDLALALAALLDWNRISVDASGFDHSQAGAKEQLGPVRAAKVIAIVHIAMFESINAVQGGFNSYVDLPRASSETSIRAAIAQSAHDTLMHYFPAQAATFPPLLAADLAEIADGDRKNAGIALGHAAANAILAMRTSDGSNHVEQVVDVDYITSPMPGRWRQDPISLIPLALGSQWGTLVRPFVLNTPSQFRCPVPPAMDSPEYAVAYNEVLALGGDGITTATTRTPDQTIAGIYWGYDGTPSLCAPPRLYNQIVVQLATERDLGLVEMGRLLAIVNVAQADAGIASWESKYFYDYWRPIGGIREADAGTGPTGLGDNNPATTGDTTFMPLGAPASNLMGPNFTPPFPAYPSGHATFGGAIFETLRNQFATDNIAFTFVSDEYNGVTLDNEGNPRPLLPRTFSSLSQAEEENGQSRIYLGIHWSFDKTAGIAMGRQIADYVWANLYVPIP